MASHKPKNQTLSRRAFLKKLRWAPVLFLPAPIRASPLRMALFAEFESHPGSFPFADFRLTPHYPAKSPLDDVLRHVIPGGDEYVTEKYAFEIMRVLGEWSQGLKEASPALAILGKFLDASMEGASLVRV